MQAYSINEVHKPSYQKTQLRLSSDALAVSCQTQARSERRSGQLRWITTEVELLVTSSQDAPIVAMPGAPSSFLLLPRFCGPR